MSWFRLTMSPPMLLPCSFCAPATILESFIQAQKISVRRALRRGFRKYLADPSDFFALLLVELQKMVRPFVSLLPIFDPLVGKHQHRAIVPQTTSSCLWCVSRCCAVLFRDRDSSFRNVPRNPLEFVRTMDSKSGNGLR